MCDYLMLVGLELKDQTEKATSSKCGKDQLETLHEATRTCR